MPIELNNNPEELDVPIQAILEDIVEEVVKDMDRIKVGDYVKILKHDSIKQLDIKCSEVKKGDTGVVRNIITQSILSTIVTIDVDASIAWSGAKGYTCYIEDVERTSKPVVNAPKIDITQYLTFLKSKNSILLQEISTHCSEISSWEQKIFETTTKVKDLNRTISSHTRSVSGLDKIKLEDKIKKVYKVYDRMSFDGRCVIGLTKPVTLTYTDWDKKLHKIELGTYYVKIDIVQGVTIKLCEPKYERYDCGYIHPHIEDNGHLCLGTWQPEVKRLHTDNDYAGLLILMYQFLSECDCGGWYINAQAFTEKADDMCHDCWHIMDDCECDICDHCGEHNDNCDCTTCPSTGDRIDDDRGMDNDYCDGCDHRDEDGCNY